MGAAREARHKGAGMAGTALSNPIEGPIRRERIGTALLARRVEGRMPAITPDRAYTGPSQ